MKDYKKEYEQAFERAKNYYRGHTLDVSPQAAMEYVFPELKESKDEKIRKEILQSIQDNMCVIHKDKCIAWLERQVEQKSAWREEDYDEMGVIACHLDNMGNEAMANSLLCIRDKYNNVKPKQELSWSEEDEDNYDTALWHIKHSCGREGSVYNWLKSLKQRMKGE